MVIYLTGADTYRSQRRFEQLRDAWRERHDSAGMNTIILDGQTVTAEDFRGAVVTQGFFSNKRFIGLNRWQSDPTLSEAAINETIKPHGQSKEVVIVIRTEQERPASGRRAKTGKKSSAIKLLGATVEQFDLLSPPALERWVTTEAKRRGGQIAPSAIRELILRTGSDLWRMHHDLDKLLAYAEGRVITLEDVSTLVPAPEVTDMFALTDAVGHRQTAVALRLLENELSAGTHPLAIVSLLANHLATIRSVQRQSTQRPAAAIASHLGLHPFVVKKSLEQSRQFEPAALAEWHHRLVDIDATLKRTPLDAATLLDVLIIST